MPNEYPFEEKLLELINDAATHGVTSGEIVSTLEFFKLMAFHEFIYKTIGEKDGE